MNPTHPPLTLTLPTDWTPEQALAVTELLDELREQLYSHYLLPIQTLLRDGRLPADCTDCGDPGAETDDPPF